MTGAIHVHPNGRYVSISNRASGTTVMDGKPVWEGGENTIGVYAIDQNTGEPSRIQNADSRGMHARTFALDAPAALLVAESECRDEAGWHGRARFACRVSCER